jgi:biotin transport system substrate-specific component
MLNFNKLIEVIISLQIIIISTFIPVSFSIPFANKLVETYEIPITWQIPSIVMITLIFRGKIVIKAFSIYLIIGLFFIPVFHQGGSLGYLLTPNFGYLLGMYPLIKIIDNLNKRNQLINYYELLKYVTLGICSMHLIGIIYNCILVLYFKQPEILLLNISKYSLGKIGYHLLVLIPVTLLIRIINNNNNSRYQR